MIYCYMLYYSSVKKETNLLSRIYCAFLEDENTSKKYSRTSCHHWTNLTGHIHLCMDSESVPVILEIKYDKGYWLLRIILSRYVSYALQFYVDS